MKKSSVWPIILISLLFLGWFIYLYFGQSSEKRFYWVESYRSDDQEPYGLYVLHQLMNASYGERLYTIKRPLHSLLDRVKNRSSVYFLWGRMLTTPKKT
ncbi:MAG: hypothetical protein HC880_07775 [Bacteroidia bacterium]|nr:hypothetical protein [Bacteroidia bacterium]